MRYRLEELFDLQMGKTPARANLDYWNGTNKWVSISDLSGYDKYVADTKECISDLGVSESGIKVVPKNTVIMSFKLSIGKTAITTEDVYTNEAIMAFIDKGVCEINTDYLYYLFSGTDWNKGTNKAVLGLTLNKATLSKKEIDIPDLHTQNEVVKKLDALSNVIQLQKLSLDKLDELIKSRFLEMFGDCKSNPYCFEKKKLKDTCVIITGNTPSRAKADYYGDYIEWIKSDNIMTDRLYPTQATEYLSVKGMNVGRFVDKDSILMSCIAGSLSSIGRVCITDRKVAFNQQINALSPKEYNVFFLYVMLLLSKDYLVEEINMALKGILSKSGLGDKEYILPPIDLQKQFADFVTQVEKQKATVQQSIDKLETLKKSLMQEYFKF